MSITDSQADKKRKMGLLKKLIIFIVIMWCIGYLTAPKGGGDTSLARQANNSALTQSEPALPLDKRIENLHASIKLFSADPTGGLKGKEAKDIRLHTLLVYSFASSITQMQEEVATIVEGRDGYIKAINAARADLSKLQKLVFPKLRQRYAETLGDLGWEHDMYVSAQGKGGVYLELVNGAFASNKNIKSMEDSLGDIIDLLRFRETRYRWYKGGGWQGYEHENPADGEIAIVKGHNIVPVPPLK